jgi:hypothetical protein
MSLVGKPERETQSRERGQTVDSPGAIYHAMDRGGRREDIFVDDGKGETAEQKGSRVIA